MASKYEFIGEDNEYKKKVREISSKCRRYLLKNGKSPDLHIYELDSSFFDYDQNDSKKYLKKVKDYYESLDKLEKMILINDCLEMGRHYRFWYLSFFYARDYKKILNSMYRKFAKAF